MVNFCKNCKNFCGNENEKESIFRFWGTYLGVKEIEPHPEIAVTRITGENQSAPVLKTLLG